MEPFPDLSKLSDDELRELIRRHEREENEVSYRRRILHGQIGLLRAELVARLQKAGEGSLHVDLRTLSDILAGKAPIVSAADEDEGPGTAA